MKFLILLSALSFISASAHATYYSCYSKYYIAANYSGVAYGKEVKSVSIHAGVLEEEIDYSNGTSRLYWNEVVNQPMYKVGDHFFARYQTVGERGGGNGRSATRNLGPVVQYWITFTDGSSLISPTDSVPVDKSFGSRQNVESNAAIESYYALTDAEVTSGFETYAGSGCN